MPEPIRASAEQVRYFRSVRQHLAGGGAPDAPTAASAIGGAQAQVESWGIYALAMRTAGVPDAASMAETLYSDRALVRTWGQRGTLHLYSPEQWALYNAARKIWSTGGRRGGHPTDAWVEAVLRHITELNRPFTRSDLFDAIAPEFIDAVRDHPGAGSDPRRFAASRLIWALARDGEVVHGPRDGREQSYLHRRLAHPGIDPGAITPSDAAVEATRQTLRAFGPATVQDIAHHLGARVGDTRRWLKALRSECVDVHADGREDLFLLESDIDALRQPVGAWPTRLLAGYDTVLMGHRDKRWILPDESEEKLVWCKAAVVMPVVLHRGQIVAVWQTTERTNDVDILVTGLSGWDDTLESAVLGEAERFATHRGLCLGACAFS